MDILKMLADLRQERQQIEEAIMVIERLASGHGKRRGRPPAWMMARTSGAKQDEAESAAPAKRKRAFTPAQKRAQAERMKAYWAKRNAGK